MAVRVSEDKCTGCRICILACPEPNVIKMKENKKVAINETRCKMCLLCVCSCPQKALYKDSE